MGRPPNHGGLLQVHILPSKLSNAPDPVPRLMGDHDYEAHEWMNLIGYAEHSVVLVVGEDSALRVFLRR